MVPSHSNPPGNPLGKLVQNPRLTRYNLICYDLFFFIGIREIHRQEYVVYEIQNHRARYARLYTGIALVITTEGLDERELEASYKCESDAVEVADVLQIKRRL